jgi:hypothetical protein
MKSKVLSTHLSTPHFVEWGVSDEEEEYSCEYFEVLADAQDFADKKVKQKMSVWVGEIGVYVTDRGNEIRDYMYYWSNEDGWGPNEGRGSGFPHGSPKYKTDYTPFDQIGWKGR